MTWARIDDGLHDHPKFVGLPLAAVGVWTLCLAYAGKRRSASIPRELPRRFGASAANIRALVNAGLWEEHDTTFVIHDWSEYAEKPSTERTRRFRKRHANGSGTVPSGTRPEPEPVGVVTNVTPPQAAVRVFAVWQETTNRSGTTFTADRRRVVAARMREKFSEEDLCDACRGWVNDPWEGRPQQNDLTQLLRSGSTVEKFRDLWRNGKPPVPSASENPIDRRIRNFGRNLEVTA